MGESQFSRPEADRFSYHQDSTVSSLVSWGPDEKSWPQAQSCRQVGDTLVCSGDIYASNKPAFRAIISLQESMGLIPSAQIARTADTQPPPYYPPGTYMRPTAGQPAQIDQYSYHQGPRPGQVSVPGTGGYDPYSFHQGDRTPGTPPWVKPGGSDLPLPPLPMPPGPGPRPTDQTQPSPQPRPRPEPCEPQPYNPGHCQPCRPHWYPGMIAGRVIGRIFGGRGRCR